MAGIVGACPSCGSPIYGVEEIEANEYPRPVRSCFCPPLTSLAVPMRATPVRKRYAFPDWDVNDERTA